MEPRRAWSLPALVAAGIAAAVLAPRAFAADPHPALPARTAAQLIAAVERSRVQAISGDFRTVADLGLPQLPSGDIGPTGEFMPLLTGGADWHVWIDGIPRQRLALLGSAQEYDVIDDVGRFWTWDSATQTATRVVVRIPGNQRGAGDNGGGGNGAGNGSPFAPGAAQQPAATPMALANRALHQLGPSTRVRVGPTARVAGRPAYTLELVPRTTATLIGRVEIAVDATRGLPLQVAIFPRGRSTAAFTSGFTSVSFARPPHSVFRFRPPPGARIRTSHPLGTTIHDRAHPRVIGSGWGAVVAESGRQPMALSGLQRDATNPVPGGRILVTRLVSVFLGDDGRVLAGAVPPQRLQQLAATLPAGS